MRRRSPLKCVSRAERSNAEIREEAGRRGLELNCRTAAFPSFSDFKFRASLGFSGPSGFDFGLGCSRVPKIPTINLWKKVVLLFQLLGIVVDSFLLNFFVTAREPKQMVGHAFARVA